RRVLPALRRDADGRRVDPAVRGEGRARRPRARTRRARRALLRARRGRGRPRGQGLRAADHDGHPDRHLPQGPVRPGRHHRTAEELRRAARVRQAAHPAGAGRHAAGGGPRRARHRPAPGVPHDAVGRGWRAVRPGRLARVQLARGGQGAADDGRRHPGGPQRGRRLDDAQLADRQRDGAGPRRDGGRAPPLLDPDPGGGARADRRGQARVLRDHRRAARDVPGRHARDGVGAEQAPGGGQGARGVPRLRGPGARGERAARQHPVAQVAGVVGVRAAERGHPVRDAELRARPLRGRRAAVARDPRQVQARHRERPARAEEPAAGPRRPRGRGVGRAGGTLSMAAPTAAPPATRAVAGAHRRSRPLGHERRRAAYLMLAPGMLHLAWWIGVPTVATFVLAFTRYDILAGTMAWAGLDNFVAIFRDPVWWTAVWNTVVYTFFTVPVAMAIAVVIAVLLNTNLRARAWYRTAVFMPHITATVAIALVWM